MATGDIILPSDGAGKRTAAQSLTEDSVIKHIPRYKPEFNRVLDGSYSVTGFTQNVIVATAPGVNNAGIGLIYNPPNSGKTMVLKRVMMWATKTSSSVRFTGPRISFIERLYFAGTLTGATVPVNKLRGTHANSAMYVASVNTGLSSTAQEILKAWYPIVQLTTTITHGHAIAVTSIQFDDEEAPLIEPGQLFRFGRQLDNGDATDGGRHVNGSVWWDEYTTEF